MGSKNRIAKHILPIMLKSRGSRVWVEPFVGGANIIDKVSGVRLGNDNNPYLIALLKAIQAGWVPPTQVDKETYGKIKHNMDLYSPELVGFVGFACSFGGRWWEGYAKDSASSGRNYNYAAGGSRSLVKQSKRLVGARFACGDYLHMVVPKRSLIYCDPPYEGTKQYNKDVFNHLEFWQWCRDKAKDNHIVFISEYSAPNDFVCVLDIFHATGLNNKAGKSYDKRVEKLFRFEPLLS